MCPKAWITQKAFPAHYSAVIPLCLPYRVAASKCRTAAASNALIAANEFGLPPTNSLKHAKPAKVPHAHKFVSLGGHFGTFRRGPTGQFARLFRPTDGGHQPCGQAQIISAHNASFPHTTICGPTAVPCALGRETNSKPHTHKWTTARRTQTQPPSLAWLTHRVHAANSFGIVGNCGNNNADC